MVALCLLALSSSCGDPVAAKSHGWAALRTSDEKKVAASLGLAPSLRTAVLEARGLAPSGPNGSFGFVSACEVAKGKIVAANYKKLYVIDLESDALAELQIDPDDAKYIDGYHPTGVAFAAAAKRLFVANYTGNNIAVFEFADATRLRLVDVLRGPHAIGPEGVAVSDDARALAVANYDGGDVALWHRQASGWRVVWSHRMQNAHGVALDADRVFAVSTQLRKVVALDRATGDELASVGHMGRDALGFLHPTQVDVLASGELLLTDPGHGRLTVLDRDLQVRGVLGANGPGFCRWNWPYDTVPLASGEWLVLSTFGDRLISVQPRDAAVTHVRFLSSREWLSVALGGPFGALSSDFRSGGDRAYDWAAGPRVKMLGERFMLSHQHLFIERDDVRHAVYLPLGNCVLTKGTSFKTTLMLRGRKGSFLWSPQSVALVYVHAGRDFFVDSSRIPLDCWESDGRLMRPDSTTVDLLAVEADALARWTKLKSRRDHDGLVAWKDVQELFLQHGSKATTCGRASRPVDLGVGPAGKRLLGVLDRSRPVRAGRSRIDQEIERYWASWSLDQPLYLDELAVLAWCGGLRVHGATRNARRRGNH